MKGILYFCYCCRCCNLARRAYAVSSGFSDSRQGIVCEPRRSGGPEAISPAHRSRSHAGFQSGVSSSNLEPEQRPRRVSRYRLPHFPAVVEGLLSCFQSILSKSVVPFSFFLRSLFVRCFTFSWLSLSLSLSHPLSLSLELFSLLGFPSEQIILSVVSE